jgi:hypothetical protein
MGIDYEATMLVGLNVNDLPEAVSEKLNDDGYYDGNTYIDFIFGNCYEDEPACYLGFTVCHDDYCEGTEIDLSKVEALKEKFYKKLSLDAKVYLIAQVS